MTIVTLIVQYESSGRYLRDKGQIVEVQVDDQPPRPPKGSTDPDQAGRWLEANGFQLDPTASRWIDKLRTTFRPRRKQIFRKIEKGE